MHEINVFGLLSVLFIGTINLSDTVFGNVDKQTVANSQPTGANVLPDQVITGNGKYNFCGILSRGHFHFRDGRLSGLEYASEINPSLVFGEVRLYETQKKKYLSG